MPRPESFPSPKTPWGTLEGNPVSLYTLTAPNGFTAKITDYGATLVSLLAPDKEGKLGDVILGFVSLSGYLQPGNPYFGCTVGRYANRIANARFTLDGKTYPPGAQRQWKHPARWPQRLR